MSGDYEIRFHPEFFEDLKALTKADKEKVFKQYKKTKENPKGYRRLRGKGNC